MQVGDLVELSAYGKNLKCFLWLHGRHGIVIKRLHKYSVWQIHWFGKTFNNVMKRKDIKHVKAKKRLTNLPTCEIIS